MTLIPRRVVYAVRSVRLLSANSQQKEGSGFTADGNVKQSACWKVPVRTEASVKDSARSSYSRGSEEKACDAPEKNNNKNS